LAYAGGKDVRVGFGYDIHPLVSGRALILGGVKIPFEKGLDGHSDADVLCHAVSDALLGAAALGDIGEHFPDTDPEYKDASSVSLLKRVGEKLLMEHYKINNIDITVVAEAPKLFSYKKAIAKNIASSLNLSYSDISIKATTNEGFESVGQHAVASVEKIS
jgi:2-C-methyl-D-erythritol 2,4-cyclodiphosphate synthase